MTRKRIILLLFLVSVGGIGLLLTFVVLLRRGSSEMFVWQVGVTTRAVGFSPDDTVVAAASDDGIVRLWDTQTGQLQRTLQGIPSPAGTLAFSPDGTLLAVGHARGPGDTPPNAAPIEVWRVADGLLSTRLDLVGNEVTAIAFEPGGQFLAAGGGEGQVALWRVADWQPGRTIAHNDGKVLQISFDRAKETIIVGTARDRVWRWHWPDDRLLAVQEDALEKGSFTRWARSLALSPDGQFVATSSLAYSPWAYSWRQADGTFLTPLESSVSFRHPSLGCDGGVRDSLAISFDSRRVAGGMGRSPVSDDDIGLLENLSWPLCVWDAGDGHEVAKYTGHEGPIKSVAWNTTNTLLVSGSDDGTVRLWHLN